MVDLTISYDDFFGIDYLTDLSIIRTLKGFTVYLVQAILGDPEAISRVRKNGDESF